jgi:hypothetical protein
MQAVAKIILGQLNGFSIYYDDSFINTVGIASDRSTEVAGNILVVSNAVKTQHYVF